MEDGLECNEDLGRGKWLASSPHRRLPDICVLCDLYSILTSPECRGICHMKGKHSDLSSSITKCDNSNWTGSLHWKLLNMGQELRGLSYLISPDGFGPLWVIKVKSAAVSCDTYEVSDGKEEEDGERGQEKHSGKEFRLGFTVAGRIALLKDWKIRNKKPGLRKAGRELYQAKPHIYQG